MGCGLLPVKPLQVPVSASSLLPPLASPASLASHIRLVHLIHAYPYLTKLGAPDTYLLVPFSHTPHPFNPRCMSGLSRFHTLSIPDLSFSSCYMDGGCC